MIAASLLVLIAGLFAAPAPAPTLDEVLAALAAGDDVGALALLTALTESSPDAAPAWVELAALGNRTGRPEAALAAARQARRAAPEEDLARLEEGRALAALGRTEEAMQSFRGALDCRPSVRGHLELASLLARTRQTEAAEAEARRAIALEPGAARAHGGLGRIFYYTKRYRDAALAFAEAERLGLEDAALFLEHGRALESVAALEAAAAHYQSGLSWLGDDARVWRRLGAVLLELGRAESAVAPLEQALARAPRDPETLEKLGLALARAGRKEEGAARLGEALAIDPDFPRALYALGTALRDLGRDAEADAALLRFQAVQAERDRADHQDGKIGTLNRQGLLLYREGRHAEAISAFEAAIALGPRRGAIHANLGLARLAAGEPALAALAFEEAIARDGARPELTTLLEEARAAARGH